jgi:hypothetical protein
LGATPVPKTTISLERLLWRFQNERGLYLLGAGASAGIAPFGADFMMEPGLDYVKNVRSFGNIPDQSPLTRRVIKDASAVLRNKRIRRFDLNDDYNEEAKLYRLSNAHVEFFMVNALASPRYKNLVNRKRQHCNYGIFNFFKPSLLMNYNLDGLATDVCGLHHEVVPVHGSVGPEFGSPEVTALMSTVRDWGIGFDFDDLLLCVPEPNYGQRGFWRLHRRLNRMWHHVPDFVVIIGYRFASADQTGEEHDDRISLDYFTSRFRNRPQTIYVIAPDPDPVRERLEERLKSKNVIGVPTYWNMLTRAVRDTIVTGSSIRLERAVGQLLDKHGDRRAFLMAGAKLIGKPADVD